MYERILAEMKKKGIRFVAELERTAGLSQGSIKNIRYGHIPTPDRLVKIADIVLFVIDSVPYLWYMFH